MQHRCEIGKGKAGEAILRSKIQQTTGIAQLREVIDVESSSHFYFGVEIIDNTILKENQSKTGMQAEYTDQSKGVNIQDQQQNYNEQKGKQQHSGMQYDYTDRNEESNIHEQHQKYNGKREKEQYSSKYPLLNSIQKQNYN